MSPADKLQEYLDRFTNLHVNVQDGHESPHKPCMLLAVIGMAEAGVLSRNEIRYEPPLLDRYAEIFDILKTERDHPNPHFPFFHLQREGFWHLKPLPGRETEAERLASARSHSHVTANFEYARLDDALFALLHEPGSRQALRDALISRWFPGQTAHVSRLTDENICEYQLRESLHQGIREPRIETYERAARGTAFRRLVTEIYDYRCAASGKRVMLPGNQAFVQAAHLIPHSESFDDDPRNGIALTPDFHWAMDQRVIAPGPDYKWHVSKALDHTNPENSYLFSLSGNPLQLPTDKRFWPREDALAARHGLLLD